MNPSQMKVTKTLTLDAPQLGQRIKAAREADSRSLTSICKLVGMTTMNWYRIESEQQSLPIETLEKIEQVLGVEFGVSFEDD